MLVKAAAREYRTWIMDSRRWAAYRPRPDDIVIATYPKCGTTWMQRIVGALVFGTARTIPVMDISPWIDRRMPQPIEAVMSQIEAQTHRRFLKTHMPLDGLPYFDEIKYIHVARDGRDACMSFHNHCRAFTSEMLARLDAAGLADETIARVFPGIPESPTAYFRQWLTQGEVPGDEDGSPVMSFFHAESNWWEARMAPNILFVHFNDLKADLAGEMRRIAAFLEISVAPELWPELVAAADFEAMRRDGDIILGAVAKTFTHGAQGFFHKGVNGRWAEVATPEDLALYDSKARSNFAPTCARWLAEGQLEAADFTGREGAAAAEPLQ